MSEGGVGRGGGGLWVMRDVEKEKPPEQYFFQESAFHAVQVSRK